MVAAMKSVVDENTPISRAAEMHGVPKSTLHDRISGNVTHGDKPGPDQLLYCHQLRRKSFQTF